MTKVREYIDSVGGFCHLSAVRIITALEAENARLRAVVEKLPKTADGVPLTPGMELWHSGTGGFPKGDYAWAFSKGQSGEWFVDFAFATVMLSKCYSTREAAEAAKGAKM